MPLHPKDWIIDGRLEIPVTLVFLSVKWGSEVVSPLGRLWGLKEVTCTAVAAVWTL